MEVFATIGHFMELKDINIQNNFLPSFEYMQDKKKKIFYYIDRCKGQDVYIATDPDREGYAIGKMFFDKIKNVAKSVYRAEFHEITQSGIAKGLKEATLFSNTNTQYYNSFLARRVGDRLIGYSLSPYLSRQLEQKGLSAGRVQTPALSLIVDREKEIQTFENLKDEEKISYQIQAKLENHDIVIKHIIDDKEVKFDSLEEANKIFDEIRDHTNALIKEIKTSHIQKAPPKPFITSTLLKEGSRQLGLSTQKIQQLAQNLFEAGLITYLRTDAEFLSLEFLQSAQEFYSPIYPDFYERREYQAKNSQAEAHEAIRITRCHTYEDLNQILNEENITDPSARSLYELIFKNTICSQGKNAIYEKKEIFFKIRMTDFKCSFSKRIFDGFFGIFQDKNEEKQKIFFFQEEELIPLEKIYIANIKKEAPKRYKEADFISILEKKGIGRPSTYASYLPLLLNREYIEISNDKYRIINPTAKGIGIIDFLKNDSNQWILDLDFTKEMEEKLDLIAKGEFKYLSFMEALKKQISCDYPDGSDAKEKKIYPPSPKQIQFVENIAEKLQISPPENYKNNVSLCKQFIDQNIKELNQKQEKLSKNHLPSPKQIAFAKKLAEEKNKKLPDGYKENIEICKKFIDEALGKTYK